MLDLREKLSNAGNRPSHVTVQIKLENGHLFPQTGTLEFGEAAVDTTTGTVTLRARFPNPDGLLLPGMFVRVTVPQTTVRDGILVPQQGVTRDAKGNATALVVGRDGKVAERTITTAQAIGDTWLVTSGLNAGDRVIVQGVDKVKAGDAVKAVAVKRGK